MTWRRWGTKSYKNDLVIEDGAERGGLNTTESWITVRPKKKRRAGTELGGRVDEQGVPACWDACHRCGWPTNSANMAGEGRQSPGKESSALPLGATAHFFNCYRPFAL